MSIQNTTRVQLDERALADHVRAAIAQLSRPTVRADVLIVDDAVMSDLHEQYRRETGTTDVLTFEASQANGPIEADIAVCVDVARRNAAMRGHSVERELLLYILHGLLHCAGFDDHDDAGFAAMHAEEDRILEAIGVGATFQMNRSGEVRGEAGDDVPPPHKGPNG